tara:strand:- start:111 stop:734 length:624 start_codon:yes stop_codon:yes gene_type:complete
MSKINEEQFIKSFTDVQAGKNHWQEAAKFSKIKGDVVEMGVYSGYTINIISETFPDDNVYGFDSFEGLPEPWVVSDSETLAKGHFDVRGSIPSVNSNVTLIKGFFSDTLPVHSDKIGQIKYLHIDSDLYSSAVETLEAFNSKIVKGTVIVFDEFCKFVRPSGFDEAWYDNWKQGEYKAFVEWIEKYDREVTPIFRGYQEQVCFIVDK